MSTIGNNGKRYSKDDDVGEPQLENSEESVENDNENAEEESSYRLSDIDGQTRASKRRTKQKESDLDDNTYASLPWPIDLKYLDIIKQKNPQILDKPRETCKREYAVKRKCSEALIKDVMKEGDEFFHKIGFDEQLTDWLRLVHKANPKPKNPLEYLIMVSNSENLEVDVEYKDYLLELKKKLGQENQLTFELMQIQTLCGLIDQKSFGFSGKNSDDWAKLMKARRIQSAKKLKQMKENMLMELGKDAATERKQKLKEKTLEKMTKYKTARQDLQLWKKFKPPELEFYKIEKKYEPNDGRIRDWFQHVINEEEESLEEEDEEEETSDDSS